MIESELLYHHIASNRNPQLSSVVYQLSLYLSLGFFLSNHQKVLIYAYYVFMLMRVTMIMVLMFVYAIANNHV